MNCARILVLACSFALAPTLASCSDSGKDADTTPPQVTLNVIPYSAVEGFYAVPATWSDDVAVVKVTAWVDGQPAGDVEVTTKMLDTTKLDSGLHKLALQVSDSAGNTAKSAEFPVVLAGKGKFLAYQNNEGALVLWTPTSTPGWSGFDLAVATDALSIEDQRAFVMVAAGFKTAHAFFRWKGEVAWSLGFDIGMGKCPDEGTKLASKDEVGLEGISEVLHTVDAGMTVGQWFGHVRFTDGADHAGHKLHIESLYLVLP
jgi:hypothetical protein